VGSIIIDADTSALSEGSDYEVYIGDGSNGELGYTYIVPLTSQSGVLDADYTYTPNTKKTITFSDLSKLVSYYEVKFVNTDENGKEFTLTIPKAYSTENLTLNFVSDDAVDETMKVPIKLTAFPDDSNIMLYIEDEQSVI
jgi:aspartate 1-decarboxylase